METVSPTSARFTCKGRTDSVFRRAPVFRAPAFPHAINRVTIIGGGIDRTFITANFTDASLHALIDFQDQRTGLYSLIRGATLQRQSSASPISGVYSAPGTYARLNQVKVQKFGLSGVVGDGASVVIDSSSIQDNTSPGVGGGVCIFWASDEGRGGLVMNSSSVTGNAGSIGGGIRQLGPWPQVGGSPSGLCRSRMLGQRMHQLRRVFEYGLCHLSRAR